MTSWGLRIVLTLSLALPSFARAEDPLEILTPQSTPESESKDLETLDAPILQLPPEVAAAPPEPEDSSPKEEEIPGTSALTFAARIDTSYAAGGPVAQGFNLTAIRLTAQGFVERTLDYKLSLGQTREFSSVLLPQVMPVEAFLRLSSSNGGGIFRNGTVRWKLGMFTPELNPQWTPDLSDLNVPDYAMVHQEVFINRDLGTEISYLNSQAGVQVALGAFNGNGIFAPNTNNAKAFSFHVAKKFSLPNSFEFTTGYSLYALFQSTPASLNYKYRLMSNVYLQLAQRGGWLFLLDGVSGIVEDNLQTTNPRGGGLTAILPMLGELGVFSRVEYLSDVPSLSPGSRLLHAQVGPLLKLGAPLTIFALYDFSETSSRPSENTFVLRFRLVI